MHTLLTQTFCLMCNMQELYLYENNIGDIGVEALAKAAAGGALASCQKLFLNQNQIGDSGVEALAQACAGGAMAHLNDLYLQNNPVSDETKGTMRTAMSKRSGQVHF